MATSEVTYEATSRFVEAGPDLILHYHDVGQGFPLVCLHGGGPGASGWSNFSKNVEPLSRDRRVVVFDLPQFGRSSKVAFPDEEVYPSGFADSIDRALETIGIPQADFVGNSLGAGVACMIAHRHPSRVRKLVLMGPGGMSDSILTPVPMDGLRKMFTYYEPGPPSRERMREILTALVFDPTTIADELVEERYTASVQPDVLDLRARLGPGKLSDVTGFIHTLTNPTLIMFGLEDRVLALDAPLWFARRMPDCELLMLPRAGHWVMWERPDDFNRAVAEFLGR